MLELPLLLPLIAFAHCFRLLDTPPPPLLSSSLPISPDKSLMNGFTNGSLVFSIKNEWSERELFLVKDRLSLSKSNRGIVEFANPRRKTKDVLAIDGIFVNANMLVPTFDFALCELVGSLWGWYGLCNCGYGLGELIHM